MAADGARADIEACAMKRRTTGKQGGRWIAVSPKSARPLTEAASYLRDEDRSGLIEKRSGGAGCGTTAPAFDESLSRYGR